MAIVPKNIVLDEQQRPVAVQIPYLEWIRIENELGRLEERSRPEADEPRDLSRHFGVLSPREEPLEFQRRIRDEWA